MLLMSDSQIKPIKINPELLSMSPRNVKKRTLKKSTTDNIKPNKLKQNLLAKIKNYRQNKRGSNDISNTNNVNGPVGGSMDSAAGNNVSIVVKNKPTIPTSPNTKNNLSKISANLEDDDFTQSINYLKTLSHKKNKKNNSTSDFPLPSTNDNLINNDQNKPTYGCMKNGSLPTYREWKNKTLKKSTIVSNPININIDENRSYDNIDHKVENFREEDKIDRESEYKEYLEENKQQKPYKLSKRSTTLKYHLGKRGRSVGVLVKNATTRKKVSDEHNLLRQTKLSDMKSYLKRHNLLKSGSRAPPDVIKKMYEQSLLGGDIRNSNKTNVIHNYLAE